MTLSDIVRLRLINQQIAQTAFTQPHEIVQWLGAMQAQEFAMAKWAIGLRLPGTHDSDIEKVFNEGSILRTHLLRPTWHFVTPADIRWLLYLTAPRVNQQNAYWNRKFELDATVFKKTNNILVKSLQDGRSLTRTDLNEALKRSKIIAEGSRLAYILMRAELDALICSGPRKGKQFTYALLDERAPVVKPFHREEALAQFCLRFFRSRGPAMLQDVVYWSGLTMKEVKDGVAAIASKLDHKTVEGHDYYFTKDIPTQKAPANNKKLQATFLLPDYDEYGMSYKNRAAASGDYNNLYRNAAKAGYNHLIIIDGVVGGSWRRTVNNNEVQVDTSVSESLSKAKQQEVAKAVKKYCSFM
jgi:Winged helix DNA-binding domain